jgi:hypothetical protein
MSKGGSRSPRSSRSSKEFQGVQGVSRSSKEFQGVQGVLRRFKEFKEFKTNVDTLILLSPALQRRKS